MKEKREQARLDMNLRVDWRKATETSNIILKHPDVTKNISAGGLCLIMDEKIKIGDGLQMRMELPSKKTIDVRGRAMWISEYEINRMEDKKMYYTGIEFTGIQDEYKEELNKLVFKHLLSKPE